MGDYFSHGCPLVVERVKGNTGFVKKRTEQVCPTSEEDLLIKDYGKLAEYPQEPLLP